MLVSTSELGSRFKNQQTSKVVPNALGDHRQTSRNRVMAGKKQPQMEQTAGATLSEMCTQTMDAMPIPIVKNKQGHHERSRAQVPNEPKTCYSTFHL